MWLPGVGGACERGGVAIKGQQGPYRDGLFCGLIAPMSMPC